jgi:hypothetical protein
MCGSDSEYTPAAHSFGLGTLWFTLFDKKAVRAILDISVTIKPQ